MMDNVTCEEWLSGGPSQPQPLHLFLRQPFFINLLDCLAPPPDRADDDSTSVHFPLTARSNPNTTPHLQGGVDCLEMPDREGQQLSTKKATAAPSLMHIHQQRENTRARRPFPRRTTIKPRQKEPQPPHANLADRQRTIWTGSEPRILALSIPG